MRKPSDAIISECGLYRYALWRGWDDELPTVLFIGLNPSTADATLDDPTIRRCVNFSKQWGYGSLLMANLFAFRATSPADMKAATDPVGRWNDSILRKCMGESERVICAWGMHGSFMRRDKEVHALVRHPFCLGVTKQGNPKHPLYLKKTTVPSEYHLK